MASGPASCSIHAKASSRQPMGRATVRDLRGVLGLGDAGK
ncbi:MAG: hypothetical protein AVDCRST_MAG27-3203 [uncultured Craurococcus sp.]|uniref:Uncharacterized protein n=1 Tax=uncultured Craurococcus sp. TaxID=1135998 RepID=A0A6J4JCL4_9PROT|nr:MAG: hypothetical protein AVDCRST_MAG27-3203 [uncultured Craurococcus sp.]